MRTSSVTVIRRDKEIDIAVGDTRIVILIHLHGAKEFLWPVLRQRPSDSSATGILSEWPENNFPSSCFGKRDRVFELLWPCWCSQLCSLWFTRSCSSFQISSRSTTRRSKPPGRFVKRCVLDTKRIIHWVAFAFLSLCRTTAVDYSVASPQERDCWLTSAEDALQMPLHHFTVPEL